MDLLTLWPWPLTPKTVPVLGYLKVIPYTEFEQFGVINFWVMLRMNRERDTQTDGFKNPTHADDIVGVGSKC